MNTMKKTAAGAVLGGALLAAGGLGLAHAAPPAQSVVSDGNVNVTVTAAATRSASSGTCRWRARRRLLPLRARLPGSPGGVPGPRRQRHRGARDLREPWQRSDLHVR